MEKKKKLFDLKEGESISHQQLIREVGDGLKGNKGKKKSRLQFKTNESALFGFKGGRK